jgi:hypothetical protein
MSVLNERCCQGTYVCSGNQKVKVDNSKRYTSRIQVTNQIEQTKANKRMQTSAECDHQPTTTTDPSTAPPPGQTSVGRSSVLPSVLRQNAQRQLVRERTPKMCSGHTHDCFMFVSSEQAWDPISSSSAKLLFKTEHHTNHTPMGLTIIRQNPGSKPSAPYTATA